MLLMQVLILQFTPKMVLNQSQKMQKLWHLLGTVTNVKSEQEYYLAIVKSEQEYIVSSNCKGGFHRRTDLYINKINHLTHKCGLTQAQLSHIYIERENPSKYILTLWGTCLLYHTHIRF